MHERAEGDEDDEGAEGAEGVEGVAVVVVEGDERSSSFDGYQVLASCLR